MSILATGCLHQHLPLSPLCVYMGSRKKCSLWGDGAPCPMALDNPSNVPLPCFLLLPQQLTENIHFAMGLENPTRWNSGNQVCNPKSSTSHRQITSLFLSLSICHLGYTQSTPWRFTGENRVEEVPILLTAVLKALGDTWPQTAPKGTKQHQEDRVCCD